MIDESDYGKRLVAAVAERIASRYRDRVVIEYPMVFGAALSVAIFRPNREGAAEVQVTAFFDWSFQVDVANITLMEDQSFVPPESEHVARIVAIVDEIAKNGFAKVRTVPVLGPLSPVEFESSPNPRGKVVRQWLPW